MGTRLLLVLAIMVLLGATCKKNESGRQHLLIESTFEETSPFRGWDNDQHCCDYSLIQSTAKHTEGTHSLRLEVRNTDSVVSSSIRSELVQSVDEPGTERWYGFNMYLENWDYDDAGEHVFQWHPDNLTGVATASLWTSGGRYVLARDPSGSNTSSTYIDIGPVISNQWVSWVIHVKWAVDNTGILQIWKNDSLAIDLKGVPTCPPEGVYFKLGINKFGWANQQPSTVTKRVFYYDEVRIGDEKASYIDVKPDFR